MHACMRTHSAQAPTHTTPHTTPPHPNPHLHGEEVEWLVPHAGSYEEDGEGHAHDGRGQVDELRVRREGGPWGMKVGWVEG